MIPIILLLTLPSLGTLGEGGVSLKSFREFLVRFTAYDGTHPSIVADQHIIDRLLEFVYGFRTVFDKLAR